MYGNIQTNYTARKCLAELATPFQVGVLIFQRYKGLSVEEIKGKLTAKAFPYAVLMENWQGDFNLSQCVRNANAFGAKEVYYIGKKRYDKRGAVGTYNYTDVKYLSSTKELVALKNKYTFIGVDNIAGSVPIEDFEHKDNSLFLFGEEGCGLTPDVIKLCDELISITQHGSVRSLNAGCSSGIVLYDYTRKYGRKHELSVR